MSTAKSIMCFFCGHNLPKHMLSHSKCKVDNDNGHHCRQSVCKDLERELVFSWLWKTVFLLPVTEPVIFVLMFLKNNLNNQIDSYNDACIKSVFCLLFVFTSVVNH